MECLTQWLFYLFIFFPPPHTLILLQTPVLYYTTLILLTSHWLAFSHSTPFFCLHIKPLSPSCVPLCPSIPKDHFLSLLDCFCGISSSFPLCSGKSPPPDTYFCTFWFSIVFLPLSVSHHAFISLISPPPPTLTHTHTQNVHPFPVLSPTHFTKEEISRCNH